MRHTEPPDGSGIGQWRGGGWSRSCVLRGGDGFVYRYNVSAGTITQPDSGLIIDAGHTSTLAFGKDGNLWLGEQPIADLPNGGRVRVYLATDLASLP